MAFSAVIQNPRVVVPGGAVVKDNHYKADTGAAWSAGDPLRITTSGTLKPCAADEAASINCIALTDYATSEGAVFKPVLMIATDTEFEGQLATGTPATTDIGDQRIWAGSTGLWAVAGAGGSNPAVEITDIWVQQNWFRSGDNEAGAYGLVRFKVLASRIALAKTS